MFRLLVVALLLPAVSCELMRGVQILNHRAMCTKADLSPIPLKDTSIWLHQSPTRESTQHLKEWVTDGDGYVRDNTLEITDHALFDGYTRLMYHVHCASYGPLCPGVAESCKDPKMLSTMSDQYVVLPCVWNLEPFADEWEKEVLNGGYQTVDLPIPGGRSYSLQENRNPFTPSGAMTTSGDLTRQISIPNHRMVCQRANGSEVPLANQFIELYEDNEQLYEWETDSEGFIRDNTSVHHSLAKFLGRDSKTSLQYYVNCATYGRICPGVNEACANQDNLSPSGEWLVLPFITELPNTEGQKMLNGWWSSIGLPYANWPYAIHHGKQAVSKRSARAMRKMLQ